jgi:choloylglycine hydrolase
METVADHSLQVAGFSVIKTGGLMKDAAFRVIMGFVLFLLPVFHHTAYACTTFVVREGGKQLFGRNYDFGFGDGYIIINKRGVSKAGYESRLAGENGRPAVWISKYGSITFNQYGREFPQGGMNEAGLIVETMALISTRFPQPDSRPYLPNTLLWRQYLLDTCASVRDVIDSDSKVRVSYDASKGVGTHFLILDREGNAAAVEFLDGKMVVYHDDSLPVPVLTNSTYEESLSFYRDKTFPAVEQWDSIRRFVTAADLVGESDRMKLRSEVDYSFDILGAVTWPQTKWSIVYDNQNLKIYLTTSGNSGIRTVELNRFDLSCTSPVKILDINSGPEGDVTQKFQDYSQDINATLVKTSFGKLESRVPVPNQVIELMSRYPERCVCRE